MTAQHSLNEEAGARERSRICMLSARRINKKAFQCSLFESQDVLVKTDDVDLIILEPGSGFETKTGLQRRLLYRDITRRLVYVNPGVRPVRIERDYDLFIIQCQNYWDLLYLNAIEGWKQRCKVSVCWIDEMWASEIPLFKYWLHYFQQFDYVFAGNLGTVQPLSEASGRECCWLPGAVDVLRFSPYPNPPERVIDVYSIGRRWEGIHRNLLKSSRANEIFYVYDSCRGAEMEPFDYVQHRELLGNMSKRTRFFMVAPPKMDVPEEISGQVEVGYRYYEGAAGGGAMIGQAPRCKAFEELFPWPDAVIEIQPDGSDVLDVIDALRRNPERIAALGRRSAGEAALRHDWVYRWQKVLKTAGLQPTARMKDREKVLKQIAEMSAEKQCTRANLA